MRKFFIIRYPGSNCLSDCQHFIHASFLQEPKIIEYDNAEHQYNDGDFILIPGGFSFGDINGSGVIAAAQPATHALSQAVKMKKKVKILGICNGFQILVYAGLLPGSFSNNKCDQFVSYNVSTKLFNKDSYVGDYSMPVANGFGRYVFDSNINYQEKSRLMLYYHDQHNYSGSDYSIAGISNIDMNIFGIMPHPDRAFNKIIHSLDDGVKLIKFFESL